jgi:hypothetical protein
MNIKEIQRTLHELQNHDDMNGEIFRETAIENLTVAIAKFLIEEKKYAHGTSSQNFCAVPPLVAPPVHYISIGEFKKCYIYISGTSVSSMCRAKAFEKYFTPIFYKRQWYVDPALVRECCYQISIYRNRLDKGIYKASN